MDRWNCLGFVIRAKMKRVKQTFGRMTLNLGGHINVRQARVKIQWRSSYFMATCNWNDWQGNVEGMTLRIDGWIARYFKQERLKRMQTWSLRLRNLRQVHHAQYAPHLNMLKIISLLRQTHDTCAQINSSFVATNTNGCILTQIHSLICCDAVKWMRVKM